MRSSVFRSLTLALLAFSGPGTAQESAKDMATCQSAPDHALQRQCMSRVVEETMKEVAIAEQRVRQAIAKWDEDREWKGRSLGLFEKAIRSFREFQSSSCDAEASAAAGGNAAGDLRLGCEYRLAVLRLRELAELAQRFDGRAINR